MERVYNFSAGPAMLPETVLQEAAAEMLDYRGSGMSVMEMSHRSDVYDEIQKEAEEDLRTLLNVPPDYEILFLQGGASQQFAMIPMNFMKNGIADYIITGHWAKKAFEEAGRFGKARIVASGEDTGFCCIPDCSNLAISENADYVYMCENNTIYGTRFKTIPETKGKPLICDASSCLLSRPTDVNRYGMLYACAQKNIGLSGVVIVIIHKDLIPEETPEYVPTMLRYKTHATHHSLYNTPPCYSIYICGKVFKWLLAMGGLPEMELRNKQKAQILYDVIDHCGFFKGNAEKEARSDMNITFTTGDARLDHKFIQQAETHGLVNLKGHRKLGGMRASLYNAMPIEGGRALASFMEEFAKQG